MHQASKTTPKHISSLSLGPEANPEARSGRWLALAGALTQSCRLAVTLSSPHRCLHSIILLTSRPSLYTSAVQASLSRSSIIKCTTTKRDHRQARAILGATSVGRACHKHESLLRLPDKDSGFVSSLSCGRNSPFCGFYSCFFCRQSNSTSPPTFITALFLRFTPIKSHHWIIRRSAARFTPHPQKNRTTTQSRVVVATPDKLVSTAAAAPVVQMS